MPTLADSFESELLLPGEALGTFPLSAVTPVGPSMPLSMFNISYDSQALPSVSKTHFILLGNLSLDLSQAKGPSIVGVTSIITGDPLSPVRSVLDLLTQQSTVPGTQGIDHPQWYPIFVGWSSCYESASMLQPFCVAMHMHEACSKYSCTSHLNPYIHLYP